ncbi:MAG: hypothetical protein LBO78_00915 [Rickettsiales bacterium]|nr:hypothetical protein [Rickettsiales bacterium]
MKKLYGIPLILLTLLPNAARAEEEYGNYYLEFMHDNYVKRKKRDEPPVDASVESYEKKIMLRTSEQNSMENLLGFIKRGMDSYFDIGVGISQISDYRMTGHFAFGNNPAEMHPSKKLSYNARLGWRAGAFALELDASYASDDEITTSDNDGDPWVEYNQKMEMISIGPNAVLNFFPSDYLLAPFIGAGLGYARISVAEFGVVKMDTLIGKPAAGGVNKVFGSGKSSAGVGYLKGFAGLRFKASDQSNLVATLNYTKYGDLETQYLIFKDLDRLSLELSLRTNF